MGSLSVLKVYGDRFGCQTINKYYRLWVLVENNNDIGAFVSGWPRWQYYCMWTVQGRELDDTASPSNVKFIPFATICYCVCRLQYLVQNLNEAHNGSNPGCMPLINTWYYWHIMCNTGPLEVVPPSTVYSHLCHRCKQCFFLTKGPAFHVMAIIGFLTGQGLGFRVYITGFLTGWSYFSMSFDGLAAKVDCDWLSFGMWRVQKETLVVSHQSLSWHNGTGRSLPPLSSRTPRADKKNLLFLSCITKMDQNFINIFSWVDIHNIYYILKLHNQI